MFAVGAWCTYVLLRVGNLAGRHCHVECWNISWTAGTRLLPAWEYCGIGHAYVQSANVLIERVTQGVLLDQPVGPRVC